MLTRVTLPGGSNQQVQFNDSGAFGGDAGLAYAKATDTLSVVGSADGNRLVLKGHSTQTNDLLQLQNSAGTVVARLDGSGGFVFNESGANVDCRVEGDTDANLLFTDASADMLGIGTNAPAAKLHVSHTSNQVVRMINTGASGTSGGAGIIAGHDDGAAMASGDRLAFYIFAGFDGSQMTNPVALAAYAEEAFSGSALGSYVRIETTPTGGTSRAERMRVTANGNVVIGTGALSTGASNGFLYIPTCAGTPTGTPTSYTGRVPLVYDTSNNRLYVYNGSWKSVTLA
jgi:hypothetical protein